MTGRLNSTQGMAKDDDLDNESVTSFASGPVLIKPTIKYAWSGNSQVIQFEATAAWQCSQQCAAVHCCTPCSCAHAVRTTLLMLLPG